MLTFLAPAALIGLSLLAIPIVIHLLKPRKVRRTPFSSLRWLHLTQQRLSRRMRWHQVLLFLLRAAFIALLVAAVAKPMFQRGDAAGSAERFVVLDVSRSMGYRADDRPTPLEKGKQAAAVLLSGGGANDRTALLTVAAKPKILGTLAADGDRYAPKLAALAAEPTDTHLGAALDSVRTLLTQGRPQARIELFFVTDGRQGAWRSGDIESFVAEYADRAAATIVNVGEPKAQNGWIADARFLPAERGLPPAVDVQLRASGGARERTIRLTGARGLNERSQTVTLDPDRPTDVRFELPFDFDPRGQTCEAVLDPPDALPEDDRWYVPCDVGAALNVLVVEGRGDAAAGASPGFALQTAVEALSFAATPIRTTRTKFNEVEPADFQSADVVFLADVPELSDVAVAALADGVAQGLGLAMFLGPGVDADFYARRFIDPLDRTKRLLPLRLDRIVDVPQSAGGAVPLAAVAWEHPLLKNLFDPKLGDLAEMRIKTHYRFAGSPDEATTVLAAAGETPMIIERSVGRGKVILFNTTADDAWSTLPRQKSFVPLVDRLLNHLSGGARKRSFTAGESVALMLPQPAEGETVAVVAPNGSELTPTVAQVGHGTRLSLPPLVEPGVYRVRRDAPDAAETTFVVQVARGDSVVDPADEDGLRAAWSPAACRFVTADAVQTGTASESISLTAWAVLLAALLLALETWVVHRLCPRVNPAVAESIVQRRPLVSPASAAAPLSTPIRST